MCGRVALTASGEELAEAFGLDEAPRLEPRYNIAPTQPMLVVRHDQGRRRARSLRWGLARRAIGEGEASEPGGLLINARSETIASKPSFREAFRRRRCLIPASGFYEWKKTGGRSRPFFIRFRSGGLFALAGLWEPPPETEADSPGSCVILTTEPNSLVLTLHDRMPVILPPEGYETWLQDGVPPGALRGLLIPCPDDVLLAQPVGMAVNDPRHEGPVCLEPPGPEMDAQGRLFSDEPSD
jgi:putative SOS response-associated peptidase YedK